MILRFLLLACLTLVTVARADGPAEQSPEPLGDALAQPGVATSIMIGRALLESGDAVGALPYYRRVWEADRTSRETGIRLSEVAVLAGRTALASEVLQLLHELDPADIDVGTRLSRLHFVHGDYSRALAVAETLHEAHPGNREVLELRLDLQEGGRDYEAALLTTDELLASGVDTAPLRVRRGEFFEMLDRDAEAEIEWRAALQMDPGSADASSRLVDLLIREGRRDELMQEMQRQVDEGVAVPRTAAALADMYLRENRPEEAAEVLLPLEESGELDRAGTLLLLQLLGDLGRHDEALGMLARLEREDPGFTSIHRYRGEVLFEAGDSAGAEAALRRALELDPDDNEARVTLLIVLSARDPALLDPARERGGEFDDLLDTAGVEIDATSLRQHFLVGAMLRRQGRNDEAVGFLRRAASLPGAGEQVLFELAVAQQESGRRRAAAGTLEQLLKLDPDSPDYLNFYGYLLAEDGRELPRAKAMIERALEADPDNGAYIDSLGWVLYQQGDLEGALEQLIRAVNIVGDDPVVLEHLGDCLRDLGRLDEARRTYERALGAGADEERIRERLEGLDRDGTP